MTATPPEKRIGSFTDKATGYGVEVLVSGGKGTKSMGLVLKLPESEIESVIKRLRGRYPSDEGGAVGERAVREDWIRKSNSYAVLIGSNVDASFFPATQQDATIARELWAQVWKALNEITGKDLSDQSKSQVMRLAKDAQKHMSYGAALT